MWQVPLTAHLSQMDVVQNENCKFCSAERETAWHILCECESNRLATARMRYLGNIRLTRGETTTLDIRCIANFLKATNPWTLNRTS